MANDSDKNVAYTNFIKVFWPISCLFYHKVFFLLHTVQIQCPQVTITYMSFHLIKRNTSNLFLFHSSNTHLTLLDPRHLYEFTFLLNYAAPSNSQEMPKLY